MGESLSSEANTDGKFLFPDFFSLFLQRSSRCSLCCYLQFPCSPYAYLLFTSKVKQFCNRTIGKQTVLTMGFLTLTRIRSRPLPINLSQSDMPWVQSHGQGDNMAVFSWHGCILLSLYTFLVLLPFPFLFFFYFFSVAA